MDSPPYQEPVAAASLQVIVVDEGGLSIPGVQVALSGEGQLSSQLRTTDVEGRALFEGLQPGEVKLLASKPAFLEARMAVTLSPGQPARVELPMRLNPAYADGLVCTFPQDPYEGWAAGRGGELYRGRMAQLPLAAMGGFDALLAHPAYGAGERGAATLLGQPLPAGAVDALPLALVQALSVRGPGQWGSDGAELSPLWPHDAPRTGLGLLAGGEAAESRTYGATASVAGALSPQRAYAVGALQTGVLGDAVGGELLLTPDGGYPTRAVAFAGPDQAALVVERSSVALGAAAWQSALLAATPQGPAGRARIGLAWPPTPVYAEVHLEAGSSADGSFAIASAAGKWERDRIELWGSAAARQDLRGQTRASGRVGATGEAGGWAIFGLVGQRWPGMRDLDPPGVREREAMAGVARHGAGLGATLSARAAQRQTALTTALPPVADLELRLMADQGVIEALATLTAAPPRAGFNEDQPDLAGGLLLVWADPYHWQVTPELGLAASGALEAGAPSGGGAARLGARWPTTALDLGLSAEGALEAERRSLWLRLEIAAP